MKKAALFALIVGAWGASAGAVPASAEIKVRDVDLDGMMGVNQQLSLTATFDVRKEDLFEAVAFDFYVLLEAGDDDQGLQFLHCRTVHRFLEKQSGYTSSVRLSAQIMKCINPSECEYAVIVTQAGREVAVENSMKERWWENEKLGSPIENLLTRSSTAPMVRPWETE